LKRGMQRHFEKLLPSKLNGKKNVRVIVDKGDDGRQMGVFRKVRVSTRKEWVTHCSTGGGGGCD